MNYWIISASSLYTPSVKTGHRTQDDCPHMFRRNSHSTDTQGKTHLLQNRLSRQQKYFFDLGLWHVISKFNYVHIFQYAASNWYHAHANHTLILMQICRKKRQSIRSINLYYWELWYFWIYGGPQSSGF